MTPIRRAKTLFIERCKHDVFAVTIREKNPLIVHYHCAKNPVTTMLTYPWKCTVLHCNHLGNTWKPLVLMTRHFDYCPSASEALSHHVYELSLRTLVLRHITRFGKF